MLGEGNASQKPHGIVPVAGDQNRVKVELIVEVVDESNRESNGNFLVAGFASSSVV